MRYPSACRLVLKSPAINTGPVKALGVGDSGSELFQSIRRVDPSVQMRANHAHGTTRSLHVAARSMRFRVRKTRFTCGTG
jgi:hypothetical protein